MLEVDELSALRGGVEQAEIVRIRNRFAEAFDVGADCDADELLRGLAHPWQSVSRTRLIPRVLSRSLS
jgi:hypothetical protein